MAYPLHLAGAFAGARVADRAMRARCVGGVPLTSASGRPEGVKPPKATIPGMPKSTAGWADGDMVANIVGGSVLADRAMANGKALRWIERQNIVFCKEKRGFLVAFLRTSGSREPITPVGSPSLLVAQEEGQADLGQAGGP